jgi:hypothetical protein
MSIEIHGGGLGHHQAALASAGTDLSFGNRMSRTVTTDDKIYLELKLSDRAATSSIQQQVVMSAIATC